MYFIIDANGSIFGNINGYRTFKAAKTQCTKQRYKLWAIFDNRENKESDEIYRIEYIPF